MAMVAAAAAAAAGRRFCSGILSSPAGALRLRVPARTGDQVGPRLVGKRGICSQPEKEGDRVGRRAVLTQEEREAIARVVSESSELIEMRLQVKYYKSTMWVATSLFAGLIFSIHSWSSEQSQLKWEVEDLKSKLKSGSEDCRCSPCVHHHHHHLLPHTPSDGGKD